MKLILSIIAFVFVASVASAQSLTYDRIRIRVPTTTPCPADWTRETETAVVTPALMWIHAPLSIGGKRFLVTEGLVNRLWDTETKRTTAVAAGILTVQEETTTDKFYCALLP